MYRQHVLEAADEFYRQAVLAVDKGDEELAAELRKAGHFLLEEAVDGAGMFGPLYRLGCFMHGETVFVRGAAFTCENGIWTTGRRYPRGEHKGELIVQLSHEKFFAFLSRNGYAPRVA